MLDTVLNDYAKTIKSSSNANGGITGAIVFSVVGKNWILTNSGD